MQLLKKAAIAGSVFFSLTVAGALAQPSDLQPKPASPATIAAQAKMRASLPLDDGQDDEFIQRGFVADAKDMVIRGADGHIVWDIARYDWIKGEAPPTVNPSLWRQARLLKNHGLFKVAENVWQVRGFDAANMLVIRGDTGWIIVDPLMTTETAAVALALVNEKLGIRPVTAVIFGHSHADHFGGGRAVVTPGTNPPIIAPDRLVEETVSESVIAGNMMSRRSAYQFGIALEPGPQASVGSGIVTASAVGTITLMQPTDSIKQTGEIRIIDGVKMEFQMVPETEAPSEMNIFFPDQKTLYISEDATCTMHNVQTPRGALVRDANKWAGYLTEALNLYADRTDTLVAGHCWPRFGNDVVKKYLGLQRDNYKFIHDQTVRLMNKGETPTEIAEQLKRPDTIANEWSNRGYYGTVRHNAKGVFQRYIGWWDGIPAHLNLHPPTEQGKRYVKAMGGAGRVVAEASRAMIAGDYRWSAEILNHVVFSDPNHRQARALLADSYEQMGYQAESAIWRNYYLVGASELRGGVSALLSTGSPDVVSAMPTASFLDLMATRLNPAKTGDRTMTMVMEMTDRNETSLVSLNNSVLVAEVNKSIPTPTVKVRGSRELMMGLFLKKLPLEKLEANGLQVTGDRSALQTLQDAIETPPLDFPIVTP